MGDYGSDYTDIRIAELERNIKEIYSDAAKDIQQKLDDFNEKYKAKESIYLEQLKKGTITQEQFNAWKSGQVFQGKQWEAKKNQIISTLYNSNTVATRLINGETYGVFAANANFMAYAMEHGAGVNFGFGLYDTNTVANLLKHERKLLPEWKIDEPKDYIWNNKTVNSQITQGIIQGESLDKIAKRLSTGLSARNENTMKTFARTAMTGAQNSGRLTRFDEAEELGIKIKKEWMATLDGRTRHSHAAIDGEKVNTDKKFSNGCMYPGDPNGPAWEVYNCRCTMVADLEEFPSEYMRYDNIDGVPIKNMTYTEWYNKKNGITVVDSFQTALGKARTVQEVNALMNSQGWFRVVRTGIKQNPQTMKWETYDIMSEANLNGCDLDSAKSIAAAYEQIFEKYPQLKGRLDAPDAQPVGMKDNTYAWCYIRSNGKVQVNPNMYNNWSNVMAQYERDVISNWHPTGTTAEAIVTHEIGHAVDGLLARLDVLGGVTSSGEYRYASSSLKTTIMKRAAKLDPAIDTDMNYTPPWWSNEKKGYRAVNNHVSEYATENNQEWFAECFAEYITSANPRTVASEFGKELEKLLGKIQ